MEDQISEQIDHIQTTGLKTELENHQLVLQTAAILILAFHQDNIRYQTVCIQYVTLLFVHHQGYPT